MPKYLRKISHFWQEFAGRITIRRDNGPIDSIEAVDNFVSTRAAFVAQKTLYGYLKTRMGTRYPSMFEENVFVDSINIAKMHVYAACLSDLTIFSVAHATREARMSDDDRGAVALNCYASALAGNAEDAPPEFSVEDSIDAFAGRLEGTDWKFGALKRENFKQSPLALVKWAPIAPELKKYDAEIVENSIKFAWQEVRRQFLKRLDPASVFDDWSQRTMQEA